MRDFFVTRPENDGDSHVKSWLLLILVAILLMIVASCGDRSGEDSSGAAGSGSGNTAGRTSQSGSSGGTAESPSADAGAGRTVDVRLSEYHIDMPSSIGAGPTTFRVTNTGTEKHGIEIEGNGLHQEEELNAGEIKSFTIDLKPGTYKVYCPVGDHDEKGMAMTLTVS